MNKISREMILEKALKECLLEQYDDCEPIANGWMAHYMEQAEKSLEGRCILTVNQKIQLRKYIDMLGELTHHNYIAIKFDTSPRRHMKFIHNCGVEMYDTIAPCPISFADTVFEYGKRYELSDLLEGIGE